MKRIFTVLALALFLWCATMFGSVQQRRLVGNISDRSITENICKRGGWDFTIHYSFTKADEKAGHFIFFQNGEPNSDEPNTWMNIDGRDVKLRRVKETYSKAGLSTAQYTVDDVTVTVQVIGKTQRGIELITSATFTLRKGNRSQVVRATGTGFSCK